MDTIQQLKDEYTAEYSTTKKFFALFPEGKNDYAPHEKSMKLMALAAHIAEIFGWPFIILPTKELDFATRPKSEDLINRNGLLDRIDKEYNASMVELNKASEADLLPKWRIAMNGQTIMEWTKYGAMRHGLNQIAHHRAQLGVYYRLMDISLPGSYGPSADHQGFL